MLPYLVATITIVLSLASCTKENTNFCDRRSDCEDSEVCSPILQACISTELCSCDAADKPICSVDVCQGCTANEECATLFEVRDVCTAEGSCVECTGPSECGVTAPTCLDGDCVECVTASACRGELPFCSERNKCVECLTSGDCDVGTRRSCDQSTGSCVECVSNFDCVGVDPQCRADGTCAP